MYSRVLAFGDNLPSYVGIITGNIKSRTVSLTAILVDAALRDIFTNYWTNTTKIEYLLRSSTNIKQMEKMRFAFPWYESSSTFFTVLATAPPMH